MLKPMRIYRWFSGVGDDGFTMMGIAALNPSYDGLAGKGDGFIYRPLPIVQFSLHQQTNKSVPFFSVFSAHLVERSQCSLGGFVQHLEQCLGSASRAAFTLLPVADGVERYVNAV